MKKTGILFLCIALFAGLFAGCTAPADTTVKLYFPDVHTQEILEEVRAVRPAGSLLETAIHALLSGPRQASHARIIPKDTSLLGIKMQGTVAEINLSAPFDTGTDEARLLSRYTVIYTACAVPEVKKVKLLVEGAPLTSLRNGERLGALGKEDLTLSAPDSSEKTLLTLYFADAASSLLPEARQVTLREGQTKAEAIVTELIRGPVSAHLSPTLSPDTQLLSAEIRAGICFVDMSRTFLEKNRGDAAKENLAIYSIVNSLCTLPDITAVRFLIEGVAVEYFGQFQLGREFTENKTLYRNN